jgi:hypothetical protein
MLTAMRRALSLTVVHLLIPVPIFASDPTEQPDTGQRGAVTNAALTGLRKPRNEISPQVALSGGKPECLFSGADDAAFFRVRHRIQVWIIGLRIIGCRSLRGGACPLASRTMQQASTPR